MPDKKLTAKKKKLSTRDTSSKKTQVTKKASPKGKLVEIKTKATDSSVKAFIESVDNDQKRSDAFAILKMMEGVSKEKPKMWGSAIIGFGDHRYKSPTTGREVDWFKIGFSPRKAAISLYIFGAVQNAAALKKLGKYKNGKGCLYINKLSDIDTMVLESLMKESLKKFS